MRWYDDPKDGPRIEEALERLLAELSGREGELETKSPSLTDLTLRPFIDLEEDTDCYRLTAELPGVAANELLIAAGPCSVTLEGRWGGAVPQARGRSLIRETHRGLFRRVLPLPGPADGDMAHALLENGFLTVILPKAETSDGRDVRITLRLK
jgi:HSP20 family protein